MTEDYSSVSLDDALAKAGPAAASFARLWERLWRQDHIPPELLELCRLTLARLHDDAVELAAASPAGVTVVPARRDAVIAGAAFDADGFSEGDRAVLLFAEYYWTDPQSITDAVADDVKAHFGEPGLVFLIEALGCLDGRIRAARCLRAMTAHLSAKERAYVG